MLFRSHGWLRLNVVPSGGLGVGHNILQTDTQDVGTELNCSRTHVRSWTIENGCAYTTFIYPHTAIPSIRVTLRLADPYSLYSLTERPYLLNLSIANIDTWENDEQGEIIGNLLLQEVLTVLLKHSRLAVR